MLHCNGIDPFVTLMGNFNWGPISRNDIVSNFSQNLDINFTEFSRYFRQNAILEKNRARLFKALLA